MTPPKISRWTGSPGWQGVALALLAIAAMGGVALHRLYMQDEIPIILVHPLVQQTSGFWRSFQVPYWPAPFSQDLYRPLSLVFFTAQWGFAGGRVWPFHLLDLIFYILCVVAMWRFGRRIMSPRAAWIAAALFAVHPVHVEAVALAINQSETLVALALISGVALYLDWRRSPAPDRRTPWLLLAVYVFGCLIKENALVLPALLGMAELTLLRDPEPIVSRLVRLRPWILAMALLGVAFLWIRGRVIGNFVGSFTAEGLVGLSWGGRALTMLGVVPYWLRLLLWPAHLQEDYSPGEIVGTDHFGLDQAAGAMILLGSLALIVLCWRRRPAVSFGFLWFFVSILPVSNVIVPTGIVLAERTLFLPSVGIMLALGEGFDALRERLASAPPWARPAAAWFLAALVAAGTVRSAFRMATWRDARHLWGQTVLDSPRSYRSLRTFAYMMQKLGKPDRFEVYMKEAIEEYPKSYHVRGELGDFYRSQARCGPAIEQYRAALKMAPAAEEFRSSMVACLLYQGEYRDALASIVVGRAFNPESRIYTRMLAITDSTLRLRTPPAGLAIELDTMTTWVVRARALSDSAAAAAHAQVGRAELAPSPLLEGSAP
jgi:hypothetical protein